MNTPHHIQRQRDNHHAALETLRAPGNSKTGFKIWQALRRLEVKGNKLALEFCNGTSRSYEDRDHDAAAILAKVETLFGQPVPGLFLNTDPRGYALKIDPDKTPVPEGLATDWGQYGCLASEID